MSRPAAPEGGLHEPAFAYRYGALHAEGVSLAKLAAVHGTPAFVYAEAALVRRYRAFEAAFAGLRALGCYALKANSNQAVVATFARLGAGADIVSGGELARALAAGVPANKIVFAGVGKTEPEMDAALAAGILQFNVESEPELEALARVARRRGTSAPVGLRVNPDVDARTHAKITTGLNENKFGIDIRDAAALARRAARMKGIDLQALGVHIGSQLTTLTPFAAAFGRIVELARGLMADGVRLRRLDFGGGLGVVYRRERPPDIAAYAKVVRRALAGLDLDLVFEPGRWLVAEAGVLLTRVLYVKHGRSKTFVIVDAGMNDLIRPTLYEAWHPIVPVRARPAGGPLSTVDVVGPVCETGDYLALGRRLPELAPGDLLAIGCAGAYGAVQSSTYNSRPLAPEVLVSGRRAAVIRERQTLAALIGADCLPPWAPPTQARDVHGTQK